jgi:DNA adenine methylase
METMDTLLKLRAKPFIKWVGGKQAIANALVAKFPKYFDRYYEPFIGGGSILFALLPSRATICDQNAWLVTTYMAIRKDWRRVAAILESLLNTKDEYIKIRTLSHSESDDFQKAAYFIYLNKTCFRGLFRVNRKGEFNVPYGEYDRRYFDPDNLEAVSSVLQDTEIRVGDFAAGIDGIAKKDFVYFDPPYYKLGGYSDFNRYTSETFSEVDHQRLADTCHELDSQGIKWAVSNSDTEFVRNLFDGFNIEVITNRREINLNAQERSVAELFITNY